MYAHVPTIPGPVLALSETLPTEDTVNWHACGSMVTTDWQFDGNIFSPIPVVVTPPTPTAADIAIAAGFTLLASGIAVTSVNTPSLNGIYSLTEQSQLNINAVDFYVNKNGTFPQGKTTTNWIDKANTMHTFPDTATFIDFANKVADFVDIVEDYINSGGTIGSLPSNMITII